MKHSTDLAPVKQVCELQVCPLFGQVHEKCVHHAGDDDDRPCDLWPVKGSTVCHKHGGAAGQVKRAAARRLMAAEALGHLTRETARLGRSVDVDPLEVLEELIRESAANVVVLRLLVSDLDLDVGPDGIAGRTGSKTKTAEAQAHVYVSMYDAERDRLQRWVKDALALGMDERRVRVAEVSAKPWVDAITTAIESAGLDPDQKQRLRTSLAEQLRKMQKGTE